MKHEKMLHMANQIAQFFAPYPQARAEAGVVEHLEKFWTPAMRRQLAAHLENGGADLHPLVRVAAGRMRVPAAAPASVREL